MKFSFFLNQLYLYFIITIAPGEECEGNLIWVRLFVCLSARVTHIIPRYSLSIIPAAQSSSKMIRIGSVYYRIHSSLNCEIGQDILIYNLTSNVHVYDEKTCYDVTTRVCHL